MDSNFHARFESRIDDLEGDDLVDYMVRCIPYIQQYSDGGSKDNNTLKSPFNLVKQEGCINKMDIYNKYLEDVEEMQIPHTGPGGRHRRHPNTVIVDCDGCGSSNIIPDTSHAVEVCRDCGMTREVLGCELTYKEEQEHIDRNVNYSYKRSNHFQEWLNQLQAAETTTIPQEVVEQLRSEFKKQKITDIGTITHAKVRAFLKKLKLNRYYEHVPYITNILSGVPPMRMTQELQERLKNMFNEIQSPFDKHCPVERKNFLSYSYVLYKFCELLSEDDYLVYFPLLKSREKLAAQDSIWKDICNELRWEYILTV
jgi:hypothetical protein